MWIGKAAHLLLQATIEAERALNTSAREQLVTALAENRRLDIENTRLRADLDWFKLRLNAVEKERAQLISAAIGVKISIPEFSTTQKDPVADALQEFMPALAHVGGDAEDDTPVGPTMEVAADYSQMPGYRGAK